MSEYRSHRTVGDRPRLRRVLRVARAVGYVVGSLVLLGVILGAIVVTGRVGPV